MIRYITEIGVDWFGSLAGIGYYACQDEFYALRCGSVDSKVCSTLSGCSEREMTSFIPGGKDDLLLQLFISIVEAQVLKTLSKKKKSKF